MENLSQKMLPEGGSGTGTCATRELQKLVAEDSSQLTLHWVLELLDKEISKYPGEVIIVDMVPNLKFLLRIPELSKECSKEMAIFEEKVQSYCNFFLIVVKDIRCQSIFTSTRVFLFHPHLFIHSFISSISYEGH